jgi:hypothetical protein
VDEAVKELGGGEYPGGGIIEAIGLGQYEEKRECWQAVFDALEARSNETD